MVILLLFNDRPELSFREIQEATRISSAELKRQLQSMACSKTRVSFLFFLSSVCVCAVFAYQYQSMDIFVYLFVYL
jgi:hypothetical protein